MHRARHQCDRSSATLRTLTGLCSFLFSSKRSRTARQLLRCVSCVMLQLRTHIVHKHKYPMEARRWTICTHLRTVRRTWRYMRVTRIACGSESATAAILQTNCAALHHTTRLATMNAVALLYTYDPDFPFLNRFTGLGWRSIVHVELDFPVP